MKDMIISNYERTIPCLDKGFVRLVDCMPRLVEDDETADSAIVQMARTSYGKGTKTINDDRSLIRHLLRHDHATPFEACVFKYHIRMPIAPVARQVARHRASSTNEISFRYSEAPDDFYIPSIDNIRSQSQTNKQGSDGVVSEEIAKEFIDDLDKFSKELHVKYTDYLAKGVTREQARLLLPVAIYTEIYWVVNLRNLLHFLDLRCDSHAQQETQVFANALLNLTRPLAPMTFEAWEDYSTYRSGLKFSRQEVLVLKDVLGTFFKQMNTATVVELSKQSQFQQSFLTVLPIIIPNKRERNEFLIKLNKLAM